MTTSAQGSSRKLVLWPTQIFSLYCPDWEAALAISEQMLLKTLLGIAASGRPLDAWNQSLISGYPRVCGSLGAIVKQRPEFLAEIYRHPNCLLYYLLADYEARAPECEERLLGNGMGQYVCTLIEWAYANRCRLLRPMSYYQGHLLRDPYWALRANLTLQSPDFQRDIEVMSLAEKDVSAGAAWFWLMSSPAEPIAPYQHLFDEDVFYTVIGMHSLFERGFTARNVNVKKLTPQWAFHLSLFDSRVPDFDCEQRVLESPEWTAEYITTKGFLETATARAYDLYYRSVDSVKGDFGRPLDPQLHKWLIRVKQVHPPTT